MTQKRIVCILILTILCVCGTQHIPFADDRHEGMVLIPAGEFEMGSNNGAANERPVHTVYLDAFYMDIYEVTNTQYKAFIDANPQWQKITLRRNITTVYTSDSGRETTIPKAKRTIRSFM